MKFLPFLVTLSFLLGCTTLKGPITGKNYGFFMSEDPNDLYSYSYYQYADPKYREECRQHYVDQHPDFSPNIKTSILQGKIYIGMFKDHVIASQGRPKRIGGLFG